MMNGTLGQESKTMIPWVDQRIPLHSVTRVGEGDCTGRGEWEGERKGLI